MIAALQARMSSKTLSGTGFEALSLSIATTGSNLPKVRSSLS
jgi:hypothetical protein